MTYLVLFLLAVIGVLTLIIYRIKKRHAAEHREGDLLKALIASEFSNDTIESAGDSIINTLQEFANFTYVSVFEYDDNGEMYRCVATNNHTQFIPEITGYINSVFDDDSQPKLSIAKDGAALHYPTALKKGILSYYFLPLVSDGEVFGAIFVEDRRVDVFENMEGTFFNLLAGSLGFVIRNIIYTEQIRKSSERDSLTGLYNKRYMDKVLPSYTKTASDNRTAYTMAVCDIDHFKKFNDTYGHLHGDWVLKKVGLAIEEMIGQKAEVYRFGGEEFVVYVPLLTTDLAHDYFDKIRNAVETLHIETKEGAATPVTISIGTATYPVDSTEPSEIFKLADKALYSSKNNGRNRVSVYDPSMQSIEAGAKSKNRLDEKEAKSNVTSVDFDKSVDERVATANDEFEGESLDNFMTFR